MYNEKTIDHFSHPRNMGELKDFDAKAEGGNPVCGDVVKLWIKLSEDKKSAKGRSSSGRNIADIKFKAFGCGACIASTSAMTEMVKGKLVTDVRKLSRDDIVKYLGGLPEQKQKCSNFSVEVLKKALREFSN